MVVTEEGKRWRAGAIAGWLLSAVLGLGVLPATCARVDRAATTAANAVNPIDPGRTTDATGDAQFQPPGVTLDEVGAANGVGAGNETVGLNADLDLFRTRFRSLIEGNRLDIQAVDGRTGVRFLGVSLFDSGTAEVRPEGEAAVKDAVTAMGDLGGRMVWVEGHADDVPVSEGAYPSNWELAAARASNVAKILIGNGVPAQQVAVVSYGDTRPSAQGDSAEAKQESRRVSLAIMPMRQEVAETQTP